MRERNILSCSHDLNWETKIKMNGIVLSCVLCFSGRDVFYEHVKSYELEFSTDGVLWLPYEENGSSKVSL